MRRDQEGHSRPLKSSSVSSIDSADEQSSLLPKSNGHQLPSSSTSQELPEEILSPQYQNEGKLRPILSEFGILARGAIPISLAYMLQMSLQTVSVVIAGRDAPLDLSTAAFSYMFAMSTAWLIALGGTTALDTLCSSTFTGAVDKTDLGVLLQRAFIVLGLLYVPIAILWIFSEPLFLALGQDPEISRQSARFLTALIPGGLGYIYFEALKKFLQAQEIMLPGTYVLLITSPLNAGLNWLFIHTFNFGLLGAPIATGISYWLSLLGLLGYVRFIDGRQGWGGWSKKCLQPGQLWTFTRLALLGFIHVGTEWWAFEIVAIVAGQLGTIPLAAQSVIMTSDQIMNTIPFGVGVATSSHVGNLLGARDASGAARAANVSAWLSMILGTVVLVILMATRNNFAKIFNDDERVVKLTAEVLPYVALFQIADGLNGSCGGSLRGMGRQHIGAIVNVVSYYCGALPLGVWLAFHGWGLAGLWVGQCIALYIVGFAEWLIVAWSNWELEVKKAFGRMDRAELTEGGFAGTDER